MSEQTPASGPVTDGPADPEHDATAAYALDRSYVAALTRRVLRIDGDDAVPLLHDARDRPIATWRALGRGRVAVLTLDDGFQLVLGGHATRQRAHARPLQ